MPKMHYFSNKFSKIAKRWDSPPPASLIFNIGDLKSRDLTKLWLQADCDEIELQKISDDIIFVMSSTK